MSLLALTETQRARLRVRSAPLHSDFADVRLPPIPDVRGMLSDPEGRFYYWLTSQGYTGAGCVVEVGPWLGRSTAFLAAGLRDAGFDESLHCIDRFEWLARFTDRTGLRLSPGDDFQHLFERNVRPIYPKLKVTKADVRDLVWSGGPIELLIVDAPKQLREISAALACFGPFLVPDLSLVVFQDYLHFPSYPLACVLDRLGDRLALVHQVDGCSSASFAVRAPLEVHESQPINWDCRRWSSEQAVSTFRRILAPLSPASRRRFEPGLAMLLHDLGEPEQAIGTLRELCARDPSVVGFFEKLAPTAVYDRYAPLFHAIGIRRSLWPRSHDERARLWRRVRRVWREPYLLTRRSARRLLTALGAPAPH